MHQQIFHHYEDKQTTLTLFPKQLDQIHKILLEDLQTATQKHELIPSHKKEFIIVRDKQPSGMMQVYVLQMFCSVFKLQRYTTRPSWSIQPSVQHMKEQTHPVLLSNTMRLLALSGTSGLLQQVADLKLPLSLTQTQ